MKLVLNGEPREFPSNLSVQQLLDEMSMPSGSVACEVNLKIIKRGLYPETVLREGDAVEIIQAIGGG